MEDMHMLVKVQATDGNLRRAYASRLMTSTVAFAFAIVAIPSVVVSIRSVSDLIHDPD